MLKFGAITTSDFYWSSSHNNCTHGRRAWGHSQLTLMDGVGQLSTCTYMYVATWWRNRGKAICQSQQASLYISKLILDGFMEKHVYSTLAKSNRKKRKKPRSLTSTHQTMCNIHVHMYMYMFIHFPCSVPQTVAKLSVKILLWWEVLHLYQDSSKTTLFDYIK